MKNTFFLFIVLSYCGFANAQRIDNLNQFEFAHKEKFSNLDTEEIPYGILCESVPAYLNLDIYDGNNLTDSTLMSMATYQIAYSMLYYAQVEDKHMIHPNLLFEELKSSFNSEINIYVSHFKYGGLLKTAFHENKLILKNNQIHKTSQDCVYDTKTFYAAVLSRAYHEGRNVKFRLPKEFIYSNSKSKKVRYSIDFGIGLGYQSILENETIDIEFPKVGQYKIRVKKTIENGTELISHTELNIIDSKPQFKSHGFDREPDEVMPLDGLELNIWYGSCDNDGLLRKPLIISEGFDPTDEVFYYTKGFMNESEHSVITQQWDLEMLEKDYGQGQPLKDVIAEEGFDLIWINYNDADINIQINAEYVRSAIKKINEIKENNNSEEPNVIWGASMGGLVCKWALSEMESRGEDHDCKYLVTLDSPLQGANTPLCLQALTYEVYNFKILGFQPFSLLEPLVKAYEAVDSPASREMTYYNYRPFINAENENSFWFLFDPFESLKILNASELTSDHNAFYNEFATKSISVPHYALSNGNLEGDLINIVPGEKVLDMTTVDLFGGNFPGSANFTIQMFAAPDGDGEILNIHADLGSNTNLPPGVPQEFSLVRKIEDATPYDSAPGSSKAWDYGNDNNPLSRDFFSNKVFGFCPTISSLDVNTTDLYLNGYNLADVKSTIFNGNVGVDDYVGTSGCNNEVVFSRDGTEKILSCGELHVSFYDHNVDFLLRYLLESNGPGSQLPKTASNSDKIYNYGEGSGLASCLTQNQFFKTPSILDESISIVSPGELWVNRDDKIGFINYNNLENANETTYKLSFEPKGCEGEILISINNAGKFLIGDTNENFENYGHVTVKRGARVIIENEAELFVDKRSKLIVDGGEVIIKSGGLLKTTWGVNIIVKNGGKLSVEEGGKLQLRDDSKVIVHDEGVFEMHENSNLQLWTQMDSDYRCHIHFKNGGVLKYLGKPVVSGWGYFKFDEGNVLDLSQTNKFLLEGDSKFRRLILLTENSKLKIYDSDVEFKSFKIDYQRGSFIYVDDELEVDLHLMTLEGLDESSTTLGIKANMNNKVKLFGSDVLNLGVGLQVEKTDENHKTQIEHCNFENNFVGIKSLESHTVGISNSNITGHTVGVKCYSLQHLNLAFSNISGFGGNLSQDQTDCEGGIVVYDFIQNGEYDTNILMNGSYIINNDIGIFALSGSSCNLSMTNDSYLDENGFGIAIPDPRAPEEGSAISASVWVDCSNIRKNYLAGVFGKSVYLVIDAGQPSIGSNNFEAYKNGSDIKPVFKIIEYIEGYCLGIGDEIAAFENFWGEENYCPVSGVDYQISGVSSSGNDCPVLLGTEGINCGLVLSCINEDLPPTPCPDNRDFETIDRCPCAKQSTDNQFINMSDQFNSGVDAYKSGNFEDMENLMYPIASMSILENNDNATCRSIIHSARRLVHYQTYDLNSDSFNRLLDSKYTYSIEDDEKDLLYFPNPFSDILKLSSMPNSYFRIFSIDGKIMFESEDSIDILTGNWSRGIYYLQYTDKATLEVSVYKIIKI